MNKVTFNRIGKSCGAVVKQRTVHILRIYVYAEDEVLGTRFPGSCSCSAALKLLVTRTRITCSAALYFSAMLS